METWQNHGLSFSYPDSWKLAEEGADDERSVTLHSPGTAFWTLILLWSRPDPEEVVDSALEAFEDEYDEVDMYEMDGTLCGQDCVATDIDFVCMEMVNTASVRAVRLESLTMMVLWQAADLELEDVRPVMDAITTSLKVQPPA